ncbi:hypothetical protein evm_013887 [Chilo suppressalis]|nr:hypothetical protein evm_013887 [Chilo suppressalis]
MGDQNLLSRAPPCFGRHVKPLVPAASAVVSTRQSALGPRGGAEGETTPGGELATSTDGSIRLQPHFQVVCGGELRALLLRAPGVPRAPPTRVHTQVDYIHCLVPDLQQITACSFYWGKMDRYEAERLLDNKPEGTFLLRDSAQEEHLFSVSFRKYGRSLHARIEHYRHRFSFDSHDPAVYAAPTVTGLIDHYKWRDSGKAKQLSDVMSIEVWKR